MINKERLLENFLDILKVKSPSKNEKEITQLTGKKLKELGVSVNIDNCGAKFGSNSGNLAGLYRAENPSGGKPLFLAAHIDTVKLNGDVIPVIKDGIISNKNSECILGGDDKVAVAAIIEALTVIKENNLSTGNIYIIFTISEEIGLLGSKCLDMNQVKAEYGFTLDGDGDIGAIINRGPYQNSINADFRGKTAHAGVEPEKGINAIKAASIALYGMKLGRIDGESTSNVGKISGGKARNIVAGKAKLEMEARSLSLPRLEKITGSMVNNLKKGASKTGAELNYEIVREYDGFKIDRGELPVMVAEHAIKKVGIKPEIVSSGGGSDVNIFNSKGKKSVNLSSGMEKIHTSEEFVKVEQIVKLANLIIEICKYPVR
ncbi:MAG: M20/M25/M40 family metallo-hydrolase [Actinomycetota bacterium]|nr:M20/M25/M40 family metallo-hydrolase [Actinomycetota bacterium]